ncbi:MAG: hypothetical protein QME81_13930, partial [bacterium]|nr:hypothetical protein [bacterium]
SRLSRNCPYSRYESTRSDITLEKVSKSSALTIDIKTFEEGEIKETTVWCWKCMKNIKVVIQCKEGKFLVEYIGCPHYGK